MAGFLLDEYPSGATIYAFWPSYSSAGASSAMTNLATTDIEIYKNGSTTQRASDNGYALLDTDGQDFDGITGVNGISIDLSDNSDASFYAVGSQYTVIISTVTIDSQTVTIWLGTFRIMAAENSAGYNVVTIKDGTGTGEIDTSSGGVLVSSIANSAITANSIASDAITAAKIADGAIDAATFAASAITATAIASDAITAAKIADGAIDANTFAASAITATAIAADAITADKIATGAIDADAIAADAVAEIADGVWDEDATGHQTQGSFGQVLGDSGADTDSIWSLANTNLDATMSSRASQASVNTVDDFLDTEIADIQARLPAALTAGGNMKADMLAANGSTEAVTKIERALESEVLVTVGVGSTTTGIVASAISPVSSVNDQFNGRVVLFPSDTTTAALRGQGTRITDFDHATQTFTVTALTTAPASGDIFIIV